MARTYLITGASGFLGTHLCNALAGCDSDVHTTGRSESPPKRHDATPHTCDFADLDVGRAVIESVRPNVVFHLAGAVSAAPDLEFVSLTAKSILISTINLLILATENPQTRLVLIGSLNEGAGQTPTSPYGAAKAACRTYARMFHKLYQTNCVVVRPFMTFGPHQNPEKVLPYVITSFAQGLAPRISSGDWAADWIYVDDVVRGIKLAGEVEQARGTEIDLGRGALVTLKDMILKVRGLMQSDLTPIFGGRPDRPDEPEFSANTSAGSAILGWTPTTTLDDGLQKTIQFYAGTA